MIFSLLLFILILSFLVFIHELGHFVAARKNGVKVDEFGLGIPPRAWGKKVGETIYSLNWLPIGGFVKIRGEDFEDYDPKDPENFINKKPWQKSVILLAGIFMNFLFAVVVFYFLLSINGWKSSPLAILTDYRFPFGQKVEVPNVTMGFSENSPAGAAGMQYGDQVLKLTTSETSIEPKSTDEFISFVSDKAGQEITIDSKNINNNTEATYKVTPVYNEQLGRAIVGVQLGEVAQLAYTTPTDKLFAGFTHSINVMGYSFAVLGSLVSTSVETKDIEPVAQGVSGPVGIYGAVNSITEMAGERMIVSILDLMALLSLSLAVMNLLPFPALDGGRWVFVLFEWISGKKPSQKLEARAHQVGFAILIVFILVVTFKDIFQFLI